jgi:hypothetical protein
MFCSSLLCLLSLSFHFASLRSNRVTQQSCFLYYFIFVMAERANSMRSKIPELVLEALTNSGFRGLPSKFRFHGNRLYFLARTDDADLFYVDIPESCSVKKSKFFFLCFVFKILPVHMLCM